MHFASGAASVPRRDRSPSRLLGLPLSSVAIHLFEAQLQFQLDPQGFRARLSVPVLVWVGAPAVKRASVFEDEPEPTYSGPSPSRPATGQVLVLSLVKQDARANAFALGITVGRVVTNDVVMDDPSISRFHAYLQHDERKGGWSVTDADSQNGVWVNGTKTVGHQPVADGAKVKFGDVVTWFLEPDRFCAWLAKGADPAALS